MNISKLLVRGVTTNITDSGNSGISSLLSQKKKISNHISYEKKIVSVFLKKVNGTDVLKRMEDVLNRITA
jgi:regulator of sirC expression with transglutaminase-like and TPR domain